MLLTRLLGAALALTLAIPAAAEAASPITVSPSSYDFGTAATDSRVDHTFTITNVSGGDVTLSGGTDGTGPFGTDANGADHCSGVTLAVGEECTLQAAFLPGAPWDPGFGPKTGNLIFDANGEQILVPLTGFAAPAAPWGGALWNAQFTQSRPGITVENADPAATEVVLYVDGNRAGSTSNVNADGTALITPDRNISDGAHVLTFSQTVAGYDSPLSDEVPITVEATAPNAPQITDGPQGAVTNTTARFRFTGETGATFYCQIDERGFEPCTSPITYTGLAAGQHTFTVLQADRAGNMSVATTRPFAVATSQTSNPDTPNSPDTGNNGDTGGNKGDHGTPDGSKLTLLVAKAREGRRYDRLPVGCRLNAGQLAACKVSVYHGRVKVGSGKATFHGGTLGAVKVKLTALGARLGHIRGGAHFKVRATATTAAGHTLTRRVTRLVSYR